jgi:acyl-CoA thioesterase
MAKHNLTRTSHHPFGDLLGMDFESAGDGEAVFALDVRADHMNPHGVVHGGVLFSLADTCMGSALYTRMEPGESCATIEIKMNYLAPVTAGRLVCRTRVLHKGRSTSVLESDLRAGEALVATALGTYTIFQPLKPHPPAPA